MMMTMMFILSPVGHVVVLGVAVVVVVVVVVGSSTIHITTLN